VGSNIAFFCYSGKAIGKVDKLKKDEKGEFYNSFAYINVAKMTGAEAPNDKIYFGSPYIKYENEKIRKRVLRYLTNISELFHF